MNTKPRSQASLPLHLKPGEGRAYAMGGISAIFLADGKETGDKYSISQ